MTRTLLWVLAAVAGLVIAAGLTTAASNLSNQSVGLSSEPLTAGGDLAPTATPTPTRTATPRPTRTATPTATDDHRGRGRGRGGDD